MSKLLISTTPSKATDGTPAVIVRICLHGQISEIFIPDCALNDFDFIARRLSYAFKNAFESSMTMLREEQDIVSKSGAQ